MNVKYSARCCVVKSQIARRHCLASSRPVEYDQGVPIFVSVIMKRANFYDHVDCYTQCRQVDVERDRRCAAKILRDGKVK